MGERRLEEIIYIGARRLIDTSKKIHFVSSEEFFMNDISLKGKTIIFGASPYLYSKKNNKSLAKIDFIKIKKKISSLTYNKIIFLSSASVYGFTENNYMFSEMDRLMGASTYAMEKITFESLIIEQSKKINATYIILRIAGLFQLNPESTRTSNFLDKIFINLKNKTIEKLNLFHSGNQIRNFCSTLFLKTVLDKLIVNQNESVCYNVANTPAIKLIDLINKINHYLNNALLINIQKTDELNIHNSLNCSALLKKYPHLSNHQLNEDKLVRVIIGIDNTKCF